MRPIVILTSLAALTGVLMIGYRLNHTTPDPVAEIVQVTAVREEVVAEQAARIPNTVVPAPMGVEARADLLSPDAVFRTNTAATHIFIKQMDLRYLESSPAKATPEAKAIQHVLTRYGIHYAATPICYNFAWNYHHTISMGASPRFAMAAQEPLKLEFTDGGYGPVGDEFWLEIVAIKPKVFFGQKDYKMGVEQR